MRRMCDEGRGGGDYYLSTKRNQIEGASKTAGEEKGQCRGEGPYHRGEDKKKNRYNNRAYLLRRKGRNGSME